MKAFYVYHIAISTYEEILRVEEERIFPVSFSYKIIKCPVNIAVNVQIGLLS